MTGVSAVALVTGGSRGIGAATALALGSAGYVVLVNYNGSESAAHDVVASIVAAGGTARAMQADVAVESEVRRMVRAAKAEFGAIDVLVNNAGVTADGFTAMMSVQKWSKVLDTNLTGSFLCSREVSRAMIDRRRGSIVNVSSIAGAVGTAGQPNYSAAKAGLVGLTKSMASELGQYGIRVNAVVPGFIQTDMLTAMPADELVRRMEQIPLARVGTADEVAQAIVWLAGPLSSYITGTTLVVDGGMTR